MVFLATRRHIISMSLYLTLVGSTMFLFAILFSNEGTHVVFTIFEKNVTVEQFATTFSYFLLFGAMSIWFVLAFVIIDRDYILAAMRRVVPGIALVIGQSLMMTKRIMNIGPFIMSDHMSLRSGSRSAWRFRVEAAGMGLSHLLKYCIEENFRRSDNATARGWGVNKYPTSYELYCASCADAIVALVVIMLTASFVVANTFQMNMLTIGDFSFSEVSACGLVFWGLLLTLPFVLALKERIVWKL